MVKKKETKIAYVIDMDHERVYLERKDSAEVFYERLKQMMRAHRFIEFKRTDKLYSSTFPTNFQLRLYEQEFKDLIEYDILDKLRINGL